jgi:hypothetical protein
MVGLVSFQPLYEPNGKTRRRRIFGRLHLFLSEGKFFDIFPESFLELSGFSQRFKPGFGEGVVNPFISSGLIEDLHRSGIHIAFFGQIIQGVVQSAESVSPAGYLFDLFPDLHSVSLILKPPYGDEKNLFIDG